MARRRLIPLPAGLVLLVCLVLATDVACAQGLLESLREGVRSGGDDAASGGTGADRAKRPCDERCDGRSNWFDDDTASAFWLGLGKLTLWTAASPVWAPKALLDDPTLEPGYFARYPYRQDLEGFMAPDMEFMRQQYPWLENDRYTWLVRLSGEYGGDFDDLSRAGGQLLFDTARRWGLDTAANYLRELLPAGRRDQLWLGDVNVVFRFAQSPRLQMRTGLGMNWLADPCGSDFGFNFTYSADLFPVHPWIVSAEIDWGKLGHAGLFHGRATVGVHVRRFEVYSGYDYLDVGDAQINSAVSGVRIWY